MANTVATLQTPPGRGGIAVILLDGPEAPGIVERLFRPRRTHTDRGAGVLRLGHLMAEDDPIDEAVVHDTGHGIEINLHGGPQAARAALEHLARLGATVAPLPPAGDCSFPPTHPRWLNPAIGREMLDALPQARGPRVVAAISQQWSAGLSELARTILTQLPPAADALAPPDAARLRAAAESLGRMQKLLAPPEVVLVGPPNAGKSALTNALVGRSVSIVHRTPGTTRDWVRETALPAGVPIWLTDTAGIWLLATGPTPLRATGPGDGVDAESVRRARRRAESADLVLLLSPGLPLETPPWLRARRLLRVSTQSDAAAAWPDADVAVSAVTGEGLDALGAAILRKLELDRLDPAAPAAFTERQARLLGRAADADAPHRFLQALLHG